jgi:hypothetical protein
VALRNLREKSRKKRLHDFGENLDGSALFTDFQNAEPEAQNAREAEGNLECRLGHVERPKNSFVENAGIAEGEPLDDTCDKRTKKENEPDNI